MGMLSVIKDAPKTVVKIVGKTAFKLKKAKPQILVGGGVVIAVGSFVWAIINARKIDQTMEESEKKIDDILARKAEAQNPENALSTEVQTTTLKALDKELRSAKLEAAWKMFLLMGLPCLAFAGGLCMTIGGHIVLVKRFGEVSSAFATLQESFNRYRKMNIEEHGEACDQKYIYGQVGETEVETTVTGDDGTEQTVKCKVPIVDPDAGCGLYSFVFDEGSSRKCPRDPVRTISFLRSQEKYWNIYMETTGKPVTLSMIFEEIGLELDPDDPRNDYILIAGWRPNGDGDRKIDFGIMRGINKKALSQEENVVFLNFNCDGNIYHSARYDENGRKIC